MHSFLHTCMFGLLQTPYLWHKIILDFVYEWTDKKLFAMLPHP